MLRRTGPRRPAPPVREPTRQAWVLKPALWQEPREACPGQAWLPARPREAWGAGGRPRDRHPWFPRAARAENEGCAHGCKTELGASLGGSGTGPFGNGEGTGKVGGGGGWLGAGEAGTPGEQVEWGAKGQRAESIDVGTAPPSSYPDPPAGAVGRAEAPCLRSHTGGSAAGLRAMWAGQGRTRLLWAACL